MSVLGDIRAGIVTNVNTHFAGTIPYNQFTGYILSSPEPPCFEIDFPEDAIVWDQAFAHGQHRLELIVRAIVPLGEPDESQVMLDKWLDPSGADSLKTAVERDNTLGGKVQDLQVTRASGHRRLATDSGNFLAAEWTVSLLLNP